MTDYSDVRRFIRDVRTVARSLEPGATELPPELTDARARLMEVSGLFVIETIIRQKQLGSGPILL